MTVPPEDGTSRSPRLASRASLLFLALLIAHLAPIWAFGYFPSRDGPVHVFNANVIRVFHEPGSGVFRDYFTLNQRPDPTWFVHLFLTLMLYVAPPGIAEKVLLSACVVLLPLGVRYAVRAIDRDAECLSIMAFPFIHSYFLHMGFYSYSLSLAMTFFVLGYWLKHGSALKNVQVLTLGVLMVLLYLCHVFSLFMTYIAIATLVAWEIGLDIRMNAARGTFSWPGSWANLRRAAARPFVAALPSLALVAVFLLPRKLVSAPGKPLGERLYDLVHLMSLASFDEREVWLTAMLACLFGVVFLAILMSRLPHWQTDRRDGFLMVIAVYLFLYFTARETELATPGAGQGGSLIHMRLNPFPFFMLILWFAAQRCLPTVKRSVQVASIGLAIGLLGLHVVKYAQLNDSLAEYLSGMPRIESGTTVLPLDVSTVRYENTDRVLLTRLGNVKVDSLAHASHYIAVGRQVVPFDNYEANIGYFPVLFRPERDPYVHMGPIERRPPPVDFVGYSRRTGGQVDYVLLLLGHRTDPDDETRRSIFRQLASGYELIHTSARRLVSLYRRKDWSSASSSTPERAPAPNRPTSRGPGK